MAAEYCNMNDIENSKDEFIITVKGTIGHITSFQEWKIVYLTNILRLLKFNTEILFDGSITRDRALELGVAAHNLKRNAFALRQFFISIRSKEGKEETDTLYFVSKALAESGQTIMANVLLRTCLEVVRQSPKSTDKELMLQDLIFDIKMLKTPPIESNESALDQNLNMSMFSNYTVLESKLSIIKFALQSAPTQIKEKDHRFARALIKHLENYKKMSSEILSTIVNRNSEDIEVSFEKVYQFIWTFPPTILLEKALSSNSVTSIIESMIKKYPDPIMGQCFSVKNVIEYAYENIKKKNIVSGICNFLKCQLVNLIKEFILIKEINKESIERKFLLIIEFRRHVFYCKLLYQFFTTEKKSGLSKELVDKKKKALSSLKEHAEHFMGDITDLGCLASIFIMLAYRKHFENLTSKSLVSSKYSDINITFKKDIFELKFFYIQGNLKVKDYNKLKPTLCAYSFGLERLSFIYASNHTIPKINSRRSSEIKLLNEEQLYMLMELCVSLLNSNYADDVGNVKIIETILYCALFAGGHHISLIWFLIRLRDTLILKDGISLISREDGTDAIISFMLGNVFSNFKKELELIIKRISKAERSIYSLKSSDESSFELDLVNRVGDKLFLPPVYIKNDKEVGLLPEFCANNIETNNTTVELSRDFESFDSVNNLEGHQMSTLKSILVPSKEAIAKKFEKSLNITKSILGNTNPPLGNDILKSESVQEYIKYAFSETDDCWKFKNFIDTENLAISSTETSFAGNKREQNKINETEWLLEETKIQESVYKFKIEEEHRSCDDEGEMQAWELIRQWEGVDETDGSTKFPSYIEMNRF